MSVSEAPYASRPPWLWRWLFGWCETHQEYKVSAALVGGRVIRKHSTEPRFCASCARRYARV